MAVTVTREQALAATGCPKLAEALSKAEFDTVDALIEKANAIWFSGGVDGRFRSSFDPLSDATVGIADWLEAFASHPRIGSKSDLDKAKAKEKEGESPAVPRSTSAATISHAACSAREQAGASTASSDTRAALAEWNDLYQKKFGHIYIVCASGRSGESMLEDLKNRFLNPPHEEIAIAAAEHIKIAEKRLRGLFESGGGSGNAPAVAAAPPTEERRKPKSEERKKNRLFSCFSC